MDYYSCAFVLSMRRQYNNKWQMWYLWRKVQKMIIKPIQIIKEVFVIAYGYNLTENDPTDRCYCTNCQHALFMYDIAYMRCSYCGAKLKWSNSYKGYVNGMAVTQDVIQLNDY
jgi:hypothetical protein